MSRKPPMVCAQCHHAPSQGCVPLGEASYSDDATAVYCHCECHRLADQFPVVVRSLLDVAKAGVIMPPAVIDGIREKLDTFYPPRKR